MGTDRIVVMGLGYIGLPTAALMASKGMKVWGVDVNEKVVDIISAGDVHIVEPDLKGLVKYAVENKKLTASKEPHEADVFMIAVPTPFKNGYEPDTSYVQSAVNMILPYLRANNLVIIESTCPLGTTEDVKKVVDNEAPHLKDSVCIAYCPERVLPGRIIYELENNDRIIGGINEQSSAEAATFYRKFVRGNIYTTNARTAEMCKLVENAYRDVNIAFANELSMICDAGGINAWELIRLANRHPRVNILKPGPGVGGHCISVDPWFLVAQFKEKARLIRTGREVNNYKPRWVLEKIEQEAKSFANAMRKEPVVACLGLAFKPDIDDLRESPSLYIARQLLERGYQVLAVEPNITEHEPFVLVSKETAIEKADIIALLVAHRDFSGLDTGGKRVLDFCGALA